MATTASAWPDTMVSQRSTPRLLSLEDRCAWTLRNVQRASRVLRHTDLSILLSPERPGFITCGSASDRVYGNRGFDPPHSCSEDSNREEQQMYRPQHDRGQ